MNELQQKVEQVQDVLVKAIRDFPPVVFANSLGAEDMVLTDIIAKLPLPNALDGTTNHSTRLQETAAKSLVIPQAGRAERGGQSRANESLRETFINIGMFSLDTGRLPQETYDLMQQVRKHYAIPLQVYFPDNALVEEYVAQHGINGFYDSVGNRKGCCFVRKVEPLRRALAGKGAWITGMRRDQAATRGSLEVSSYDADNGLQKLNPLLDWSNKDVWAYIRQHDVPYNKLHDRFYPSLGCAPCTRSVTPGENIRSGRWWWENPEDKECGLHASHRPNRGGVAHGFGVSAEGNVASDAHDVSSNQHPENKECGLHVSSTSLEASRIRIREISEQAHATLKSVA